MSQLRAWIELDRTALLHNLDQVRQLSKSKIMAVIKANAYGHGLEFAAKTLEPEVDSFAVATLQEAQALRSLCPQTPISLLSGFYHPSQIEILLSDKIRPVIFNQSQIEWLEAYGRFEAAVWLKVDTGMGRLGIDPRVLPQAILRLASLGCDIGLMSHFASADRPDFDQNTTQHARFVRATRHYSHIRSLANSAAILSRPQDHYDVVRPGIMLYGSSPLANKYAADLNLRAVMRLYARLIDIKQIGSGETVGYGATWCADGPRTIGIVSIGYGDGYPRVIARSAQVAIDGRRYTLAGRVSMDSFAILLDDPDTHSIGARVELWGETISVDEVANWANTIAYELFCKLTPRITRIEI